MVPQNILDPALQVGRLQPVNVRCDCSAAGMVNILNDFNTNSYNCFANRKLDGLGDIDRAVAAVRTAWANVGVGIVAPVHLPVENLLVACRSWLENRKVFGLRVTGWREAPINELYWQAAWSYSSLLYMIRAQTTINGNNIAGVATTVADPGAAGYAGNPYQFMNSGYSHHALLAPARLVRGDTRGPLSIQAASGFQAMHLNNLANYSPWFSGNANHDTISITTDEAIAIDAGPAAHALGATPEGALPPWLAGALGHGTVRRGYVYEFANIGNLNSTRMSTEPIGREHIFLGIPNACITNWWVVRGDRQTYGPIPYPPPPVAPPGAGWSGVARQLA